MISTTPEIELLIDKLVEFIKAENKGKHTLYPNYNDEELASLLRTAILDKSLLYCTDEVGKVVAVVNGRVTNTIDKIFWVDHILITRLNVLPILVARFEQLFPGYKIWATRYGKEKSYDTPRFVRKCRSLNFARN